MESPVAIDNNSIVMTPTNRDRINMGDYLNEILDNEDLIPIDRLNELKLKENGGYSCYRGHEYVDEEHETLKGSLLFYIK